MWLLRVGKEKVGSFQPNFSIITCAIFLNKQLSFMFMDTFEGNAILRMSAGLFVLNVWHGVRCLL